MRTAVAETSLEAFHSLPVRDYLQPKELRVMDAFGTSDTVLLTRQDISTKTGMPINAVCGRVNSLVAKRALVVRGSRIDPLTHKRQELIGLPVKGQGELF